VKHRYAAGFVPPAALLGQGRVSARLGRAGVIDDVFEHPDEPKQNANLTITEIFNFEFVILHCEAKA
jgi:hypothetical protein